MQTQSNFTLAPLAPLKVEFSTLGPTWLSFDLQLLLFESLRPGTINSDNVKRTTTQREPTVTCF